MMSASSNSEAQYWNSTAARAWSERYEPIDRILAGLTEVALGAAALRPGERVLDVGCGSGTTVLEIGRRVGRAGYVLGADFAEASVARARKRVAAAEMRWADVIIADASTYPFEPLSFDLLFSRFGVMFFGDPTAAFRNLHKAMKPNGRLLLTVFRTPQENPWATEPVGSVRHLLPPTPTPQVQPGPEDPGQFSWADPARVHRILEGAGFCDVSLTPHNPPMQLGPPGGAAQAAEFAMRVGPVVRATLEAPEALRQAIRSDLETFFRRHDGPRGIVLPGAIWLIRARV
jgi:SAM-dependent methyltransferase